MKGNKAFVNEFDLHMQTIEAIEGHSPELSMQHLLIRELPAIVTDFSGLFTQNEVKMITDQLDVSNWIPVGKDGILKNYKKNDEIGSWRMTCFEPRLAEVLWDRIKPSFEIRTMADNTPTDWDGSRVWEPIGINPAFRFIRYNKNEHLIPHYDSPYIQDEEVRSLSSMVIYLSSNEGCGSTRFLHDSQVQLPLHERIYEDWTEEAEDNQVLFKMNPKAGDAVVFDHRILHDSERMKDDQVKTIIRTDIMYRRVR